MKGAMSINDCLEITPCRENLIGEIAGIILHDGNHAVQIPAEQKTKYAWVRFLLRS